MNLLTSSVPFPVLRDDVTLLSTRPYGRLPLGRDYGYAENRCRQRRVANGVTLFDVIIA